MKSIPVFGKHRGTNLIYLLAPKSLLLLALTLFSTTTTYAGTNDETVATGLSYRVAIIFIAFIIALISRGFLLRKMNKLMMKKSKRATAVSEEKATVKEVAPAFDLTIKEMNANAERENAIATSKTMVSRAKKRFRQLLYTDLVVILVYGIIGLFIYFNAYLLPDDELYFFRYFLFLFLLLLWNVMRFIGYQHQFRAYKRGLFGFFKPLWKFLFWPFQSRWCIMLSFVVAVNALFTALLFISYAFLLVTAVVFHSYMLYRLKIRGRKTPNVKLLILRVFLIKKTSSFTFAGLVNFWQHFGSYFTVADPSFYKISWKKKFNYYFPIYILLLFLVFTQITDGKSLEELQQIFGGFIFLLIIAAIVFIVLSNNSLRRKFVSSGDLLKKRLQHLYRWPTKYDNTFKEFPVMCYDNTWKQAVSELVDSANVILMDLRGFSDANKGCEYEVDFIFDHVPVERILFLAYKDAVPLIKKSNR